ncbi:MAG: DUF429 domain-containing protein [Gemmatimonadota bacterium]
MKIIGIDCATQPGKVGVAVAEYGPTGMVVETVEVGIPGLGAHLADVVAGAPRTLIAMDAPLGWPHPLKNALHTHEAGAYLEPSAHALFRRHTDRFIRREIGQQPLDVGADRIARTARAALQILQDLRDALQGPVPLAWSPDFNGRVAVIEVYPAGSLRAHGARHRGYKRAEQVSERREIVRALSAEMELGDTGLILANADALDSVVCLWAARDFLEGRAMAPRQTVLARSEGWIWCAPLQEERAPTPAV